MIIYKVTNLKNNKVYIGQTGGTLEYRKNKHEYDAQRQDRKTVYFHSALLKYGFNQFKWEIINNYNTQEELDEAEKYYIQFYNSTDKNYGYNLKYGGKEGGIFNEEAKKNLGESTKKKWENLEIAEKNEKWIKKSY